MDYLKVKPTHGIEIIFLSIGGAILGNKLLCRLNEYG
jgi:hypothetical protein